MTSITVIKGDITKVREDVIVNAANSSLLGGGGVDGAIHRAGGPAILEECRHIRNKQGGCKTGLAVITTAGNLSATKVIHTVGPVWQGGTKNEGSLLANCYKNSLQLAADNKLKTVAFPNISTGIYGYPKKEAAAVSFNAVKEYTKSHPNTFDQIIFVCHDEENYKLYQDLIEDET